MLVNEINWELFHHFRLGSPQDGIFGNKSLKNTPSGSQKIVEQTKPNPKKTCFKIRRFFLTKHMYRLIKKS